MDRAALAKWWHEAWAEGLWAAAWSKAVGDLTPAQAAWRPAPGRNSIWQIVEHMVFWRDVNLARLAGPRPTTPQELETSNFPAVREPTDAAWRATLRRFEESQNRVAAAIVDPKNTLDRIAYLLPHDCYHVGQIMYLRAMQGLTPIE
jgi:hypothetical protein